MVLICLFLIIAAHKDVDLHTGYILDLYFKVISFPVMLVMQITFVYGRILCPLKKG